MFAATNPKNQDLARYLGNVDDCSPEDVENPYMTLGTHPELVERLWDKLPIELPASARWVVGGRPVLMRRDSGVVFGIAIGTVFYALRLPEADRILLERAKRKKVEGWADKHGIHGDERQDYLSEQLEACPVGADWISGKWLE